MGNSSQSRLWSTSSSTRKSSNESGQQQKLSHFPQFYLLSDEIILEILSFVTQAPFEFDKECKGDDTAVVRTSIPGKASLSPSTCSCSCSSCLPSLTHTLPLVSKHFYHLCTFDKLWLQSLRNLVKNNSNHWNGAFANMLFHYDGRISNPTWSSYYNATTDKNYFILASKVKHMDTMKKDDFNNFIMDVYNAVADVDGTSSSSETTNKRNNNNCNNKYTFRTIEIHNQKSKDGGGDKNNDNVEFGSGQNRAKEFYLTLVVNYIHTTMPIFQMRYPSLTRGVFVNLTLFEPRYRKLISDIMKGRKSADYKGRALKHPRPKFIFANENADNYRREESVLASTTSYGFIVEVCKCVMLPGGQAEIRVLFVGRNVPS